jgi:hypothetical protein
MDGGDAGDELDPTREADRWLAEQLVEDAVRSRRRAADLRDQAAQEGTLRGVLVDLAERARPVVLRTVAGTEHRVALTVVGRDVVAGRTMRGEHATAGLDAVASVRAEPGAAPSIGDRQVDQSTTLVGHLHELASVRPDIVATLRDGSRLSGTLTTVGIDVLTIQLHDSDHSAVHVALGALADLVVLDASELR